jgi:hypothetical protein
MATMVFKFGTLIFGRQNIQGTFDADINTEVCSKTTNANLTIYIRICFQQVNPTATLKTYNDSDNNSVAIRQWKAKEWTNWKGKFLNICRNKWNGKFWLETPKDYTGLDWPKLNSKYRSNLYCRFEISEQSNMMGAHAVIPVVSIDGKQDFRSHMLLYDNRDLNAKELTKGSKFFTCAHEIGHLIGLEHPGKYYNIFAGCVTDSEAVCYYDEFGNNDGIMGMGSKITVDYAKPWLIAAALLTGTNETTWKVSLSRIYPKLL